MNYRSVRDSGWFDIDATKTILVGPNEAGKSALLQALQRINPPAGLPGFDPLRDYPRSAFNDITSGKVNPDDVTVVEAVFVLEAGEIDELGPGYENAKYIRGTRLNNEKWHQIVDGPEEVAWAAIEKDTVRLAGHFDASVADGTKPAAEELATIVSGICPRHPIPGSTASAIDAWLTKHTADLDATVAAQDAVFDKVRAAVRTESERAAALAVLERHLPTFVLFNNYFRVRPRIHLAHLAERLRSGVLDDDQYDYGNSCLLKLLGFTADQLAELGAAASRPPATRRLSRRTRINSTSAATSSTQRASDLPTRSGACGIRTRPRTKRADSVFRPTANT